jgi:transitional endoplasmic reticulum ATPase
VSVRSLQRFRIIRSRRRTAIRREWSLARDDQIGATRDALNRLDARMPLAPEQATARALWMLRLLLEAPRLSGRWSLLNDDDIVNELGLDAECLSALSPEVIRCWLAHRLAQLEQLDIVPESIGQNARWLASWLGLTEVQRELLALAATVPISEALSACMRPFARLPSARAIALLAKVLRVSADDVRASLSPQSPLVRAGLLEFKPERDGQHLGWLRLAHRFEDVLAAHYERGEELLSAICPSASEPQLGLGAFEHCSREVDLLCGLLRGACLERSRGVNVLLYGPPGSGKSQLVRALARALGLSLRQVPDVDASGNVLKGDQRLASLGTMQYLLEGGPPSLVLFDEIEDAFPWTVEGGWLRQGSASDKARTNRLLEENAVPCVWVGNRMGQLDAAFVRRFSLVVELPAPPRRVREALLAKYAAGLDVPSELRRKLAEDPALMPADMARAARVAQLVQRGSARGSTAAAECASNTPVEPPPSLSNAGVFERALAGARRTKADPCLIVEHAYDATLVNTSVPLDRLTLGLKQRAQGCICLYGPPGTGKTAYARQLAATLERPLLRRSASDLLDMYVGGTEKAISEMFDEAARSDCVLLLDEAEGLMRDRASAMRGFEVTQVNELLVRMEAFRGIFLCATNGFDTLDPASLRRFSLRVEFFPLDTDQNLVLLQRTARELGLELGADAEQLARRRLASLSLLTPGDHAAVLRGRLLLGDASVDGLLADLERAQTEKKSERRIGFRGRG